MNLLIFCATLASIVRLTNTGNTAIKEDAAFANEEYEYIFLFLFLATALLIPIAKSKTAVTVPASSFNGCNDI